jgi:hypothetical protein
MLNSFDYIYNKFQKCNLIYTLLIGVQCINIIYLLYWLMATCSSILMGHFVGPKCDMAARSVRAQIMNIC